MKTMMKTMIKKVFLYLIAAVALTACCCSCSLERLDAGCEGIQVNLTGSEKGVDDVNLVTGWVIYNPISTAVYEYPTYVQTIDYDPFTINAKDGSEFKVDPTISMHLIEGKAPAVFRKYRKELSEIIHVTLYNYVKDAFRIELNNFTTDQIVSSRDSIEKAIEKHLSETLERENFKLEQLTSGLKYPQIIVQSVDAKNRAIQEAMKAQNELAVQKAEAEKLLVAARAEKEANELRQQALTKEILQKMWIEKWDGSVPQVMTSDNAAMFVDVSKLK